MDHHLTETPAARVIRKFGGIAATATLVGRDRSVVNRWLRPRSVGGTGGIVPAKHMSTLLRKADEAGVSLEPADFFDLPDGSEAA